MMQDSFWITLVLPLTGALFLWWGLTGAIIYACGRREWRLPTFILSSVLLPVGLWQLANLRNDTSISGVFWAFTWSAFVWGWLETGYYGGFVVGKRVADIEPDAPLWHRFKRAIAANLHHELSIITLSLVVILVGAGGKNEVGLWTFMVLHLAHQSAKLNLFFGVNNLTADYLPENLRYMAQFFTKKSMNAFFPVAVTVQIALAAHLFQTALSATEPGLQLGQALLFAILAAAILEHWWLVTPLPSTVWDWALKSRRATAELEATSTQSLPEVYLICGYLGSGKTTLLQNLLPQLDGKVAVIVNDFGSVGVDAELFRSTGNAGKVLELPGGCICCSMQNDLSRQIVDLLDTYQPAKILIEPSGVAGIEELAKALVHPKLRNRLSPPQIIAVVDTLRLLKWQNVRDYTLTQLKVANVIVLSKTDLAPTDEVASVKAIVGAINPNAEVVLAQFGNVPAQVLLRKPVLAHIHNADSDHAEHIHSASTEDHHSDESENTLTHAHTEESGFISFARQYSGVFSSGALKHLFEDLAADHYGPVERAKGVFTLTNGERESWDLAGGKVYSRLLPASQVGNNAELMAGEGRFMLVANDLAADQLEHALQACIEEGVRLD